MHLLKTFLGDRLSSLQRQLPLSKKLARVALEHSWGVYQSLRNIFSCPVRPEVTEKYLGIYFQLFTNSSYERNLGLRRKCLLSVS